ncbi:MAG TPA: hypothetical protein VEL07_14455 [Planctomycetota bacterium]|nr:hypothetical protein [Planctomycetota bacterium]
MWIMRILLVLMLTVSLFCAVGGFAPNVSGGGDAIAVMPTQLLTQAAPEAFSSWPAMRAAAISKRDDGDDHGQTWNPRTMLSEPAPRGLELVTRAQAQPHQHDRHRHHSLQAMQAQG